MYAPPVDDVSPINQQVCFAELRQYFTPNIYYEIYTNKTKNELQPSI